MIKSCGSWEGKEVPRWVRLQEVPGTATRHFHSEPEDSWSEEMGRAPEQWRLQTAPWESFAA